MKALITARNIEDPDGIYDMLLAAHEGLSKAESDALNARLILTLVNHIGDDDILREALAIAARTAESGVNDTDSLPIASERE